MKIQFLNGGLANQVFQYIFARYYELSHPGEIMYLDDTYFALNTVHNGYELEKVFGLKPHMLSECFDEDVWEYILAERRSGKSIPQILTENGMDICMVAEVKSFGEFNPFDGQVTLVPVNAYHPEIMEYPGNVYYHGYWVNSRWFREYEPVFREELRFPIISDEKNQCYMKQIENTKSVSIHIRRGDYVTLGWTVSTEINQALIEGFLENVQGNWELFVFSDDLAWCRMHAAEMGFDKFHSVTYVEGNIAEKSYIDLQLMSRCKVMILSNSAFCYLAALLNKDKILAMNPTSREV